MTRRAKFWMRVVGVVAVIVPALVSWSSVPALVWGARTPGTVMAVGGALSATDGRDAYSAVVEYTPPGGTPVRIERSLQGRSGQRYLFGDRYGRRLQEGDTVTVAHGGNGAEILHVHARWAAAVWISLVGVFLFVMGTILPVSPPSAGPVTGRRGRRPN